MLVYLKELGIPPTKVGKKLLQMRPPAAYTLPTIQAINLISSKKFPKTTPVGSFIYRAQRYPGDIDLMESLIVVKNKKDPIKELVGRLQAIIRKAEEKTFGKDNIYIGDFKAGIDKRFTQLRDAFRSASYPQALIELEKLKSAKILLHKDYISLKEILVSENIDPLQRNILKDLIHNLITVRWTSSEILAGYLMKLPDHKILLYDAIQMPETIKLDLWYWMSPRYVEITNFFRLYIKDGRRLKSVNYIGIDYIEAMKKQYSEYMFDEYHFNPFKGLKRMWILSFINKDDPTSKLLTKLMSTGYAILYQIIGDLNVLRDMYTYYVPAATKTFLEVENMKDRISNIYEFDVPMLIYAHVDNLLSKINNNKAKVVLGAIGELVMPLKDILNKEIARWIKKNGIETRDKRYLLKS